MGEVPESVAAVAIRCGAEHRGEQGVCLTVGQRLKFAPLQQAVLPQGADGVRCSLAGSYGHDRGGLLGLDELVHHQCGQVVEQVGVVDEYQQPVRLGAGSQ